MLVMTNPITEEKSEGRDELELRRDSIAELGQRFVVFGAGRSGRAATRLLAALGFSATLVDEKSSDQLPDVAAEAEREGYTASLGPLDERLLDGCQVFVLSPGIPPSHAFVTTALRRRIRLIGELELGFLATSATLLAVTGTNGKSTTTVWLARLLRAAGYSSLACGNLGNALCDAIRRPEALRSNSALAVEVSSYQLETIRKFRPRVSLLLNITPDHLERYGGSLASYAEAKYRITELQQESDGLVLNRDDKRCWSLATHSSAKVLGFSRQKPLEEGAFLDDGKLKLTLDGRTWDLCEAHELPIPGDHNIENALAAAAGAAMLGASPADLRTGLLDFGGLEHRIEKVAEINGVLFVNDSKATNPESMEKALRSFDRPLLVLAGGRAKNTDYRILRDLLQRQTSRIFLFGEAAPMLADAWKRTAPVEQLPDLEAAFRRAVETAKAGDVVLLSPACASFDQYQNFCERGDHFKSLVEEQKRRTD